MEALKANCKPSDIDLLFQEARFFCRQHDRDSVQHGLWHAEVEAKIAATEASVQAARSRNANLNRRVNLLQRVLATKRAQYAHCLQGQFCSGSGAKHIQNMSPESFRDSICSRFKMFCEHENSSINKYPSAESTMHESWPAFEARVPKARKRSVRPTLIETLKSEGIEITERDLDDRMNPGDLGADLGTNNEIALLRLLRSCWDSSGEGAADDTDDMSLGKALSVAFGDGSPNNKEFYNAERDNADAFSEMPGHSGKNYGMYQIETDGPWQWQACLRSHLDGVRSVLTVDDVLLSCGEDTTIKAWDIAFMRQNNFSPRQWEDLEPYATYRGHISSALCLTCAQSSAQEQFFFSGGQDATICAWRILAPNSYDAYDPSPCGQRPIMCLRRFHGHTDAVWSLALHPHSCVLASAGADGTVRLWDAEGETESDGAYPMRVLSSPLLNKIDGNMEKDQPTGVAWVVHQTARLLAGFVSSRCAIFDVQHNVIVLETESMCKHAVTSVACLPLTDLAVVGHTDKVARVFSLNTGSYVCFLTGHSDVVTSVAADPSGGFEVVTGSHDGYVRIFDIRTGKCLQQSRLHTPKYEEAVHCVYHGGRHLVTAGADANVMVLGAASSTSSSPPKMAEV